ncbi:MAG TPA: phosphoribosylanthranilate isomerase [Burkholderiales bacterium]|jgi:phosphoribosylanthranilate isomerase|nr:phosphoribosylanthranilate isomerase [Burkholderiales bacterium]
MTAPTAVKICGITRIEDGLAAARGGAHAIGLVFYRPSPRYVAPALARDIIGALPPFVTPVALFVDASAAEVREVIAIAPVALLQFHGVESAEFCRQFGLPYVKAVRVRRGADLLQYARDYHDAKALLLDAFVEGTHGGTGQSFDWSLIPRTLPLPVVLSGGLDPQNVAGAIQQVRPWAVDVSSGVESAPGIKDAAKIAAFMSGVRNADV